MVADLSRFDNIHLLDFGPMCLSGYEEVTLEVAFHSSTDLGQVMDDANTLLYQAFRVMWSLKFSRWVTETIVPRIQRRMS